VVAEIKKNGVPLNSRMNIKTYIFVRPLFLSLLFSVAFVLNLIWENAQAPLYRPYESFAQHFPLCAKATFWDAGYIAVLYLGIAGLNRDFGWIRRRRAMNYALVVIVSLAMAWWIEFDALRDGRWSYGDRMPVIFGAGLSPLLQLPFLSLLTYEMSRRLSIVGKRL
jgi:hypothetical protein